MKEISLLLSTIVLILCHTMPLGDGGSRDSAITENSRPAEASSVAVNLSPIERELWKAERERVAAGVEIGGPNAIDIENPIPVWQIITKNPSSVTKQGRVGFEVHFSCLASAFETNVFETDCEAVKASDIDSHLSTKLVKSADERTAVLTTGAIVGLSAPPADVTDDKATPGQKVFTYSDYTRWVWRPTVLGPIALSAARETWGPRNTCKVADATYLYIDKGRVTVDIDCVGDTRCREAEIIKNVYWWNAGQWIGVSAGFTHCQPLILLNGTSFVIGHTMFTVRDVNVKKVKLEARTVSPQDKLWAPYEK